MINDEKADAIALDSTELPLVFDKITMPADRTDASEIHIQVLIDMIAAENK
jgi:aspartate/glutamate racemase